MASLSWTGAVSEDEERIDFSIIFEKDFEYAGPSGMFASITGSPFWSMSYEETVAATLERGWAVEFEAVFGSPAVRSGEVAQPFMGIPFSERLARLFAERAQPYVKRGLLRKIHRQDSLRVAIVHPESITFETDFDILFWQAISRQISEADPDQPPVVTIHGDAINPILARFLGIEMLYYHMVSNIGQGLSMGEERIENKKKIIYSAEHSRMFLELELSLLESVDLLTAVSR